MEKAVELYRQEGNALDRTISAIIGVEKNIEKSVEL